MKITTLALIAAGAWVFLDPAFVHDSAKSRLIAFAIAAIPIVLVSAAVRMLRGGKSEAQPPRARAYQPAARRNGGR